MIRVAATLAAAAASTLIVLWGVGRLLSDAWSWSQWLAWIPSPVAVLAALLGLAAAARPSSRPGWRRRRLVVWSAIATLLLLRFLFVEHRFQRAAPSSLPEGLSIVHWSVSFSHGQSASHYAERLTSLGADVYVLTNAAAVADDPAWIGHTNKIVKVGARFTFITPLPIRAREMIAFGNIHVAMLEVDPGGPVARPVTIWVVDLPSDPKLPRMALARELRRLLESDSVDAPSPDVVLGDLNMTRGSAAVRHMFPDMANAFDVAGHGYGATFPAHLPLYHIDQVLVRPDLTPLDYSIVDAGFGRHRLQRVVLP